MCDVRQLHKILLVIFSITLYVLHEVQSVRVRKKRVFDPSDLTKITYGQKAEIKSYPFIVSIQMNQHHMCGGSLILPDWVLSAGHCVIASGDKYEYQDLAILQIVAGMTLVNIYQEPTELEPAASMLEPTAGNVRKATKMYLYNYYKTVGNNEDDIGLFKLASKFDLSDTIKTIRLPKTPYMVEVLKDHLNCVVIGWGQQWNTRRRRRSRDPHVRTSQWPRNAGNAQYEVSSDVELANAKDGHVNGTKDVHLPTRVRCKRGQKSTTNRHLKTKITLIVDHDICSEKLSTFSIERQLCVDFEGDIGSSCQGDSGGPMICGVYPQGYLFGLVSAGFARSKLQCKVKGEDRLHVYTRVDFYLGWIYKTIGPKQFK